jgi:hypothetical protein
MTMIALLVLTSMPLIFYSEGFLHQDTPNYHTEHQAVYLRRAITMTDLIMRFRPGYDLDKVQAWHSIGSIVYVSTMFCSPTQ